MRIKSGIAVIAVLSLVLISFSSTNVKRYKCLLQMTNYEGEGAYIVVSLINAQNEYEKTLKVLGDDDEWYYEISNWWKFYGKRRVPLDGITGATLAGGEREVVMIDIDPEKLGKGFRIRFETAVEDKNYFPSEIEFVLSQENLQKKYTGEGFIRYVRFLPQ